MSNLDNLAVVIPFYEGYEHIKQLVNSIPASLPVIIVDDVSSTPLVNEFGSNVQAVRLDKKGYFAGAVNRGIKLAGRNDVLVLNQDSYFTGASWLDLLNSKRADYAMIGERIKGTREDFPHGYIHGTFMFMRRDAIDKVGLLNEKLYPLWGNTAEWQLRVCRKGYKVLPIVNVPNFVHKRKETQSYGSSISLLLQQEPERKSKHINTPPEVSVIIPVHGYKYAKYLPEAIASLIGGNTVLGKHDGQAFQSFEVVVVEDGPMPDTTPIIESLLGNGWLGIRHVTIKRKPLDNDGVYVGKPSALNEGIRRANGKYITVLDVDDMMAPDRLERLYTTAIANPTKVICDDMMQVTNGELVKRIGMNPYNKEQIKCKNSMHVGILYPKKAWQACGGYPEVMKYGREDWGINIALGKAGYHGYNLHEPLYWYRRDKQNRTIKNTTPDWHTRFQLQLCQEFGDYMSEGNMGCCGKKSNSNNVAVSSRSAKAYPGKDGMTWVVYQGSKSAPFKLWGTSSGVRYVVRPGVPMLVANEDLYTEPTSKADGFLEIQKFGKFDFKVYVPPVKKAVQPEALTVIENTVTDVSIDIDVDVETEAGSDNEVEVNVTIEDEPEESKWDIAPIETIGTLVLWLETAEYTDDNLLALYDYEIENKNRVGILSRLEKAIEALDGQKQPA